MTILEQMQAEGDFTDTEKNIIQYILPELSAMNDLEILAIQGIKNS